MADDAADDLVAGPDGGGAWDNRILNCQPSPQVEQDWGFDAALKADIVGPNLPDAVDLRASWWKVGDQKATGSCVGWATGDGVLRWHFRQAGMIAPDDHLSVRFLWMAAKELDEFTTAPTTFLELEGTSLKAALDVARKYGAVTDPLLPFGSGVLSPDDGRTFYARASQLKIASYFNLGRSPTQWRTWLANNGPILTRLDVDATWMNATATGGKLQVYRPDTIRGGHAVAMVGYTPEGFIIRNSWGKTWGDGGFAHASEAYAITAFTEAYGVSLGSR